MSGGDDYTAISHFVQGWTRGQGSGRSFALREFYQLISDRHQMAESAFSRMLRSLGIFQGRQGGYSYADIAVVVGWLTAVDPATGRRLFNSCAEYMRCSGQHLYKAAEGVDFRDVVIDRRDP